VLRHRLITGPILVALLLVLVWFDDRLEALRPELPRGLIMFAVALAVLPVAALELSAIFHAQGIMTRPWLTAAAAMLGLTLSYAVPQDTDAVTAIAIVASGLCGVFVAALFIFSRQHNVQGVVAGAGAVMFAAVYLGLLAGFLLALRRGHSAWWIVGVIAITKTCDTGAYFTGRSIGRHRLIPWLSPGKTWEGLFGGIMAAMAAGALLAWASHPLLSAGDHVPVDVGLVAGLLFAVVGQLGDLTVSLFKRGAGMKDSSQLLPGLGGVLDVLDSPLMVAPVAFWFLRLALP
jgi:phosphatidate cytidylyltransferase